MTLNDDMDLCQALRATAEDMRLEAGSYPNDWAVSMRETAKLLDDAAECIDELLERQ